MPRYRGVRVRVDIFHRGRDYLADDVTAQGEGLLTAWRIRIAMLGWGRPFRRRCRDVYKSGLPPVAPSRELPRVAQVSELSPAVCRRQNVRVSAGSCLISSVLLGVHRSYDDGSGRPAALSALYLVKSDEIPAGRG